MKYYSFTHGFMTDYPPRLDDLVKQIRPAERTILKEIAERDPALMVEELSKLFDRFPHATEKSGATRLADHPDTPRGRSR